MASVEANTKELPTEEAANTCVRAVNQCPLMKIEEIKPGKGAFSDGSTIHESECFNAEGGVANLQCEMFGGMTLVNCLAICREKEKIESKIET